MLCAALFCLFNIQITDGDTFWVNAPWGRQSFRLWGISAPERRDPGGYESAHSLLVLTAGQTLACEMAGPASFGRLVVACTLPDGTDLACAQVAAGHALDWPTYSGGEYARCGAP